MYAERIRRRWLELEGIRDRVANAIGGDDSGNSSSDPSGLHIKGLTGAGMGTNSASVLLLAASKVAEEEDEKEKAAIKSKSESDKGGNDATIPLDGAGDAGIEGIVHKDRSRSLTWEDVCKGTALAIQPPRICGGHVRPRSFAETLGLPRRRRDVFPRIGRNRMSDSDRAMKRVKKLLNGPLWKVDPDTGMCTGEKAGDFEGVISFDGIKASTLRRYVDQYDIDVPDEILDDNDDAAVDELSRIVKKHFHNDDEELDEASIINEFVKVVHEYSGCNNANELNKNGMPTRSSRRRARRDSFSVYDYEELANRGRKDASGNGGNSGSGKPRAPVYCICRRVSFGEMIACDSDKCKYEWFHLACVGLTATPKGKWFCPLCTKRKAKENAKKKAAEKEKASKSSSEKGKGKKNAKAASSSSRSAGEKRKAAEISSSSSGGGGQMTYYLMIELVLKERPKQEGTFKEICEGVEKKFKESLNWKMESDSRKTPVWRSSVRKILFSNHRFRRVRNDNPPVYGLVSNPKYKKSKSK